MNSIRSGRGAARGATAAALLSSFAPAATAQETERVSVDSSGVEGARSSNRPATSDDGLIVAFESDASNLGLNDTNLVTDVFVHDRTTGITELVSVDSSGVVGNNFSVHSSISSDGQVVAFESLASNLVAGDTNGVYDVFVRDRSTGITERVSVRSTGVQGNKGSTFASISADGRFVAFQSAASNLVTGDTNGKIDVFVHDRSTGVTERVSVDSSGVQANQRSESPSLSGNAQFVAFQSVARNLVSNDTNAFTDVFVRDRINGTTERVSVSSAGAQGNGGSYSPDISSDGQVVAFMSVADNLVARDGNGWSDVFVHERSTGLTERVSVDTSGAEGNLESDQPSIDSDGQLVSFMSEAGNLVPRDWNFASDIFVRDRSSGRTQQVSVDSSGAEGNSYSSFPSISADGHTVAFASLASNLVTGDSNGARDVFVHDRCISTASWSNYGSGYPGTLGVPSFTSRANPVLGTTVVLDVSNSSGIWTFGLLFTGLQRANIPTNWGGDLLVVPLITELIGFTPLGASTFLDVPDDETLCGVAVDLQAFESDSGAAFGVSFTPGVELILGR